MRRVERTNDEVTAQLQAFKGLQAGLWTALPGIIRKYNPAAMTCEVEPTIQARLTDLNGTPSWITMPLLVDCPVCFPAGGGFSLTFPLRPGDECLVVFASRCIDAWWQLGGVQVQAELRMHDLSDGFVIPGPRSQATVMSDADAANAELRSDDGAARIKITPSYEVIFDTSYNITMNATQVNITGEVNITGNVSTTGTLTNNGANVGSTHRHGGVDTGSGTSGTPT